MSQSYEKALIEAVKKNKVLYEKTHDKYYYVNFKTKVWDEIAAELNQDSNECRKKWKQLRETFVRKYRQLEMGKKTESTPWPLFENMLFLKEQLTSRRANVNEDASSEVKFEPVVDNEITPKAVEEAAKVKDSDTSATDTDLLMVKTLVALLKEVPERHRDAARAELFEKVFELKSKYQNTD